MRGAGLTGFAAFRGTEDSPSRGRRLFWMSTGLIYLCFPALEIVTGGMTGARAVWGALGLAAFIASYVSVVLSQHEFGEPSPATYLLLTPLTVLAVGLALAFGGGWLALPVYTVVVYSMALRPRAAVTGVVAMGSAVALIGVLKDHDPVTTVVFVIQVFTLGALFMGVRNIRLLVVKLRQAQSEVARLAAGDERLRIARDLHDLLGHSLSLIVLKSELAGRLAEAGSDRAVAEIRDIESVARKALTEVREAVTGYRQRELAQELDGARAALEAAGLEVPIRLSGTPLPPQVDGLLGWALREGTTNVIRHARATRCEITIGFDGTAGVLEMVDDGRVREPYEPGNGLSGLAERVEAAGGVVESGPALHGGFRLRVRVPAEAEARV
ncbi:sensor histidine kinase [Planobispora takensis]|uniref:Two-component sensor histidine kinase n=1 Tax=Planobispora takensis TaxID=1367882 RepID=A0A8J3WS44_9ACTN|nr:sensor histidine kinase [Planobispora takensis]GIH99920.1 two-component sensor histidine kinase [Planobispora takensis]